VSVCGGFHYFSLLEGGVTIVEQAIVLYPEFGKPAFYPYLIALKNRLVSRTGIIVPCSSQNSVYQPLSLMKK
jgi:hypothetical protein